MKVAEPLQCEHCIGGDSRLETQLHHARMKLQFAQEDIAELQRIIRELLEPPPQPRFDEDDPFKF